MSTIGILLQILMIIIALIIISNKDNLKIIIFFAVFSLITASLYFFNNAPDVALAEVAIGSAITPLIFIISISKQKDFIVINHTKDDFFSHNLRKTGEGYKFLHDFTKHYDLKLKVYDNNLGSVVGIFRSRNVDLIVDNSPDIGKYILKGKVSSILMNKLEQLAINEPLIEIVKINEGETYD
ncbi:DUF4040 domain-containing protein [Wukongibacter baidiensis]|uniref:Na(+)/H(+) antiporter subunit B n=1 Tax=Wukongibacter baidiensis TaxID=1723361 RepID=UPI003D7FBECD